jgi:hypothetical protein
MQLIHIIMIIAVIALILFVSKKQENLRSGKDNNDSRYAYVAPHLYEHPAKYIPEYYHIMGGYPFWYNAVTPLPWNNPTRFTTLNYYPHTRIHARYDRYPLVGYY